jgi:hypothetical protein
MRFSATSSVGRKTKHESRDAQKDRAFSQMVELLNQLLQPTSERQSGSDGGDGGDDDDALARKRMR